MRRQEGSRDAASRLAIHADVVSPPLPPAGRAWFRGAVVISLPMLAATAAVWFDLGGGALKHVVGLLSFASENNVATWWSGTLFFVAGVHALDGAVRARAAGRAEAPAWLALGAVLVALSADEVGSLHERLAALAVAVGVSKWLAFGAAGVVGAGAVAYALVGLWRAGERGAARGIVLAFGVLATVGIQEYVEQILTLDGPVALAVRAVIEEGTEVFGALVLLRVTMTRTPGLGSAGSADDPPPFAALRRLDVLELAGLLVLCGAVALVSATLGDHRGQPADWLAAATLGCAALFALRPALTGGAAGARAVRLALAAALGSMAAVGARPALAFAVGGSSLNLRLTILFLVVGAIVASAPGGRSWRPPALLAAAVLTTIAGALTAQTPNAIFLATPLFALAAYDAVTAPGAGEPV